jgi:hypothetical protein
MPSTASISRTHSQCQRSERQAPPLRRRSGSGFFKSGKPGAGEPAERSHKRPMRTVKPIHRPDSELQRDGGAYRDRTDDLKLAKLALSQLS